MSTPSHRLAQRITERLLADGFLLPSDADAVQEKLAAGTLKGEDWRLAIEKSIERPDSAGSSTTAKA